MMIKELTVSGRSDVRCIITKTTDLGNAFRAEESFCVHESALQLLVSARNGSDKCLSLIIQVLSQLGKDGIRICACFALNGLFADSIRRKLAGSDLIDPAVVCSDEGIAAAEKYSSYVLTVPDSSEGGFCTLTRPGRPKGSGLMIGCNGEELSKALTAAAGSIERNGADR